MPCTSHILMPSYVSSGRWGFMRNVNTKNGIHRVGHDQLLSLSVVVNPIPGCHRAGAKRSPRTMYATHPGSKPLSADQKALLEEIPGEVGKLAAAV